MPPALASLLGLLAISAVPAGAQTFNFSTGNPDGRIGTASRPSSAGKIETESADDFILTAPTTFINSATFTGLLTGGATPASIGKVVVEIYRVFPKDSDVGRTSGAPIFSTPQVPTRVNSPSDVEFVGRDTSAGDLTFVATGITGGFTVGNTVINGINPQPSQRTGGEGAAIGTEILLTTTFTTPFELPPDHYFIVPQVEVTDPNGEFLWLSAARPIGPDGTPFSPDLQSWIRNENLAPDWLRIGTDIVGNTTFNAAFSLSGQVVPEPSSFAALVAGIVVAGGGVWRRMRRR